MKCPYCGSEMTDGAVLCTACGRLTPEFERTYRRPDPTVGRGGADRSARVYDPDVSVGRSSGGASKPRRLLVLVIGAIVLLGALAFFIGSFLPADMAEAYQEAIDAESVPDDYGELLDAYFEAHSEGDEAAIRALFAPSLRDDADEYDAWSDNYGSTVSDYTVIGVYPHSSSDAAGVGMLLGETVEQYADVEVAVQYAGGQEDATFDFDLVRIDGTWYLYEIW